MLVAFLKNSSVFLVVKSMGMEVPSEKMIIKVDL